MPTNPDDPCLTIYDLEEGGEDIVPLEIADGSRPRASVQRLYAAELGLDFADVRVLRGYIKIHTWQEVWEGDGIEQFESDLMEELGIDSVMATDDFGNAYWTYAEADTGDPWSGERFRALIPQIVPPDYCPEFIWGAYSTVDRDHPDAIRVWHCSPL